MSGRRWEMFKSSPGDFERADAGFWEEYEARIESFEDRSFGHLVDLVDGLAPHLVQSFICMRSWWEKHRGLTEVHVRFSLVGLRSDF